MENISLDKAHYELHEGTNEVEVLADLPKHFKLRMQNKLPPAKLTFTKVAPLGAKITACLSYML